MEDDKLPRLELLPEKQDFRKKLKNYAVLTDLDRRLVLGMFKETKSTKSPMVDQAEPNDQILHDISSNIHVLNNTQESNDASPHRPVPLISAKVRVI